MNPFLALLAGFAVALGIVLLAVGIVTLVKVAIAYFADMDDDNA